jgi:aubergine-like protein
VVTVRSMGNKGAMYIATKIAIQINCKIGGAPWTVPNPCKSDMVVGIDASQDYMNRNNIYGALVASLNKTMSRFFSLVSVHNSGEDISNDLPVKLLKALNRFRSTNDDHLPARIFIYRDGLGEFNAEHVYKHEVHIIKVS